jgi:hypothetical protein
MAMQAEIVPLENRLIRDDEQAVRSAWPCREDYQCPHKCYRLNLIVMSPAKYYCWLAEHSWSWLGMRRFQPRPEQRYPVILVLLAPILTCAGSLIILYSMFWISHFVYRDTQDPEVAPLIYQLTGVIFLASGLAHGGFTWIAWNQRTARLRAAGLTAPTVRPNWFVRRLLGPFYVLLISFVTPIAVLCGIENLRGAIRWHQVRTELLAKGERLSIRELIPSPVPEAQNFASIKPLANLLDYYYDGSTKHSNLRWKDTNVWAPFAVFDLPHEHLIGQDRKHSRSSIPLKPTSISRWAEAFRAAITAQSSTKRSSRAADLPKYPAAPSDADAATIVLTALGVADSEMAMLCEASQRPYSRFAVHWEEGYSALLPHLAMLKKVTLFLELRGGARLAAGQTESAYADALCSFRLVDALRDESLLVSHSVRIDQASISSALVWRGIETHQWNEAQLAEFQKRFSQMDFLSAVVYAVEGERAMNLAQMERSLANFRQELKEMQLSDAWDGSHVFQDLDRLPK